MGIFNFIFPKRPNTAVVAKERLQIVLAHERSSSRSNDFLGSMQKELLEVVKKYVEISDDMIRVSMDKSGETSLIEINIEIEGAKAKPRPEKAAPARPAGQRPPERTARNSDGMPQRGSPASAGSSGGPSGSGASGAAKSRPA